MRANHFEQVVMLGVNMNDFKDRENTEQVAIRKRLIPAILSTTKHKDMGRLAYLDRGDGGVVIMSPATPNPEHITNDIIPEIVQRTNKGATQPIELRFALHEELILQDRVGWRKGWVGTELTFVFRILQTERLKRYQRRVLGSTAIIALSDTVHQQVDPEPWWPLIIRSKETRAMVWVAPTEIA